jgi:signal transduction histidine kinase
MTTATSREQALPRWQRALLPAVEGSAATGPHLRRSARDWLVDVVVFTIAVAIGAGGLHEHLASTHPPLGALEVMLGVIACLSLWVRRRYPLAVGIFTVVASALSSGAGGAALAGVFTVAVHCPPRWTARVALLSVLASALNAAIEHAEQHYRWGALEAGLVATTLAVGYGLYVRVRRELVISLHERARRLESEQDLRVREARQSERTRIAREMHDVLAHRISLLSVHAGALEYNPSASPEEIARAAAVIRTSARAAQEELREVIGVLRDDGTDSGGLPPPQPTLTAVPALVEESRRAGMEVTYRSDADADAVPTLIGRAIYRLVQEGLTNARKHAPGQGVTIDIAAEGAGELTVRVVNQPRVGHAEPTPNQRGSGTGLIGLSERVALVGGRLSHEALGSGGFILEATLPWSG